MTFKEFKDPKKIKKYLLEVLGRTGKPGKEGAFLYHYTSIESLCKIIKNGYFWLGSTDRMNDYLEGEIIKSANKTHSLFFSCFSRAEENLAMYKMYAPNPNGTMLSISYKTASEIISTLPEENGKKIVSIVRNNELTKDTIAAEVYWAAVCYKGLHTNTIRTGSVENWQIPDPLDADDLIGFIKLYGWEYEKEVRLCVKLDRELAPNERIAIKLPVDFAHNVKVVLAPGFDKGKYRSLLTSLKRISVQITDSEYDSFVDLGELNKNLDTIEELKKRIEELEKENKMLQAENAYQQVQNENNDSDFFSESELMWEGFHKKEKDGRVIAEGDYCKGILVNGVEYNWILAIWKRMPGDDRGIEELHDGNEEPIKKLPVKLSELNGEADIDYEPTIQYDGYFSLFNLDNYLRKETLQYFFVADKKVHIEGEKLKSSYFNFRTLERFLQEIEPGKYKSIMSVYRFYDEDDTVEFNFGNNKDS